MAVREGLQKSGQLIKMNQKWEGLGERVPGRGNCKTGYEGQRKASVDGGQGENGGHKFFKTTGTDQRGLCGLGKGVYFWFQGQWEVRDRAQFLLREENCSRTRMGGETRPEAAVVT